MKPISLVDIQLTAYNNQDLERFLICYSEDVEIYNFPDSLICEGKEQMRRMYFNSWKENPDQLAEITNRIQLGAIVIDQEHVTGRADGIELNAIAIYKIENEKICKVYFVRS